MKKMSRALLSAVLTVALLLSLAACSNADNHSSTVSSESVSTAETSSEASSTVSDASESKPIGIITAMSNELAMLLEKAEISETKTIGGVDYNIGTLEGQDVVLVQGCIGKSMAAAGTTVLINEFDVKSIIFTGIAGGVGDEVQVLDEVIATDLVFHDYGNQTNDGFVWDAAAGVYEDGTFPVDEELSKIA